MAYAAYKRVQNLIATGARPTQDDWAHVYAWRNPMTLAELLADSGGYAVDANAPASGEYVASDRIWTKDGYILDVAASGASDHDRTTAGGVKLYDIDFAPALIAARVTTAEGDITTLQGEMTTAQSDITAAEGDITALDGRVTTLEGASGGGGGSTVVASGATRLTDYSNPIMDLNFEDSEFYAERDDPRTTSAADYLNCTRSGSTWAIQPDGAIKQFAANTPTVGKLGNTFGLIRTNDERNWVLNSYTPSAWTDANSIMTVPDFSIPGHALRKLSHNTYNMLMTGVDSGASWSSGNVLPVRAFFVHGAGERFRLRIRDTNASTNAQITVVGETVNVETETLGTISGAELYRHGAVLEVVFYLTLGAALTAANVEIAVGTGINDPDYATMISGVEIGDAGDAFSGIIKTTTEDVQANRDVISLKPGLINYLGSSTYVSFELEQEIATQFVTLEITDSTNTAEWRGNSPGTVQRVTSGGGSVELFSNTPTLEQERRLVRGYFGPRYGVSLAGEPIYSAPATGNFIFAPTTIYIGGSASGTTGVIKRFTIARGRVDPRPLKTGDGSEWYDPEVTLLGVEKIIRPQMYQGDETRSTQFLGKHPMEHVRISATAGDYAASGDEPIKFRNEWNFPETIAPNANFISTEFIICVEPHAEITGTFPFFVLLQMKDIPDSGETGTSPPLALECKEAANYVLQTRTSALENVGSGATPSFTVEHQWSYTPWQAHHIVLDWLDGRGESTGLVRLWLNGTKVVDESKVTGYNNNTECEPKWGVYAGPESGTSGHYTAHFMNFRVRRDGTSWSASPKFALPESALQFPITLASQAW